MFSLTVASGEPFQDTLGLKSAGVGKTLSIFMMFTQMIKNAPSSAASRSWSVSGQDFYFAHSFAVSDSPESDRPSGGGIAIEK